MHLCWDCDEGEHIMKWRKGRRRRRRRRVRCGGWWLAGAKRVWEENQEWTSKKYWRWSWRPSRKNPTSTRRRSPGVEASPRRWRRSISRWRWGSFLSLITSVSRSLMLFSWLDLLSEVVSLAFPDTRFFLLPFFFLNQCNWWFCIYFWSLRFNLHLGK